MDAEHFVRNWVELKSELLTAFMGDTGNAQVATQINAMALSSDQLKQLRAVLDAALTDTMYTLLLGLDGGASIGSDQQAYTIHDEAENIVTKGGQLEEAAWKAFHGQGSSA